MLIRLSILLLLLAHSRGDTFTSIRDMENLFDLEQEVAKSLNSYLKHALFETEIMEMHYKEILRIESEIEDNDKYLENPINAYSVIKRMHYDWPVTFRLMSSSPYFDKEPEYPDVSVITEAIAHIVDWQIKNKLDTKALARGFHEDVKPHANLTAFDCLEIAKFSYVKDKNLAIQWLSEALLKAEEGGESSAQVVVQILEYTFLAKCLTDDLEGSVSALQSLITDAELWYTPSAELKNDYEVKKVKMCEDVAKTSLNSKMSHSRSLFKSFDSYTELCHFPKRSTEADAGLCSVIVDIKEAKFLKFESIAGQDILILYDFLTDDLIQDIKLSAIEELKTVKSTGLNGPVPLTNRKLAADIDDRLNSLLGISLKMLSADQQVFLRAPGGKPTPLNPHLQQEPGMQIGTLYYFVNDVPQGGNLVFPDLKVSIEPTKGSVVLSDSRNDLKAIVCPVIVGFKWSMTQSMIYKFD